jgi:hypothetical protein
MMRRTVAATCQSAGIGILAAIAINIAVPCYASSITWSAAQNISGDSNVSTAGTLVAAFNVGGPGVTSTTVNGVTFNPFAVSGASSTSGNFTFASATSFTTSNSVGTAAPPFSSLSASYQGLLGSLAAQIFGAPFTLTMSGLTVGQDYVFEWWLDSSIVAHSFHTTATAGSGVTLNSNTTAANGGLGQFATGTFTADAATQVITFTTPDNSGIDGFQLRSESPSAVPEPASLTLLGTGVLGVGLRKWRVRRNRDQKTT